MTIARNIVGTIKVLGIACVLAFSLHTSAAGRRPVCHRHLVRTQGGTDARRRHRGQPARQEERLSRRQAREDPAAESRKRPRR